MKVTTDACLFGAWVAGQLQSVASERNVLDIGTGTGLLSLMIAQRSSFSITAVEIDYEAYGQALENFNASPWRHRLRVFHNDVRTWQPEKTFDYIVSNPPFYENELSSPSANRNIAHHSTELSLSELLQAVQRLLNSGGELFLILPAKREEEITKILAEHSLHIHHIVYVHQTEKHDAFRLMLRIAPVAPEEYKKSDLIIKIAGAYSPDFVKLLSAYYLYL